MDIGKKWLNPSFFVLLILFDINNAYRILGIFPSDFISHYNGGTALMKGLAAVGHNITVISPFKQAQPPTSNYREIVIDGILEELASTRSI